MLDLDEDLAWSAFASIGVVSVRDVLDKSANNVTPHRTPGVLPESPLCAFDLTQLDQSCVRHDHFSATSCSSASKKIWTSRSATSTAAALAALTFR
jgi:hypothetical protein